MNNGSYHCWELDDGLLLLREGMNRLFVLNPSARLIWQCLGEGLNRGQMARRLASLYETDSSTALQDVSATLSEWQSQGLTGAPRDEVCEPRRAERPFLLNRAAESNSAAQTYMLAGLRFSLQAGASGAGRKLHALFAHLEDNESHGPVIGFEIERDQSCYRLWRGGRCLVETTGQDSFVLESFRAIAVAVYRECGAFMVMHAAAVTNGDGCILMPGTGGSGKSTLAAALGMSGHVLLGDDVIPLAAGSAGAMPFPLSINLKPASKPVLETMFGQPLVTIDCLVDGHEINYLPLPDQCTWSHQGVYPIERIVFPLFDPRFKTRLGPVDTAAALERMLTSGSQFLEKADPDSVACLLDSIRHIPMHTLTYSSLDEAVSVIRKMMRQPQANNPLEAVT